MATATRNLWPDCIDPGAITSGPGGTFGVYQRDAATGNPIPLRDLPDLLRWVEDHRARAVRWSSDARYHPAAMQWAVVALEHGSEWLRFFRPDARCTWSEPRTLTDAKAQLGTLSDSIREAMQSGQPTGGTPANADAAEKTLRTSDRMKALTEKLTLHVVLGWSATRWATELNVDASTIKKTPAWRGLMAERKVRRDSSRIVAQQENRGDARRSNKPVKR